MTLSILAVVGGVAVLAWASDQFVIGAARIAVIKRVSPIVVGAVIIGFGTSSPELLVSILAAARGQVQIAVGNIVGSNLVNLGAILGVAALILPMSVASRTVRREAPLTLGAVALFAVLVQQGLTAVEGLILLVSMAAALVLMLKGSSDDPLAADVEDFTSGTSGLQREALRTMLGLAGTLIGAQVLLWGAVDLAERVQLAEGFVGATLVAVGTSLPELVTAVQSARRKESDLLLGNLLGSNMFNALVVGGATALVGTGGSLNPALTGLGAAAAVVQVALVWWMMRSGRRISRIEGAFLVVAYAGAVPFLGLL